MSMNILKKGDGILLVIVTITIIISFTAVSIYKRNGSEGSKIAVIKTKNKEVKRIDLSSVTKPQKIQISDEYNQVILVENDRIRFLESDCSEKICVNTGWLSQKGDVAVCIPNSTMIKIEGQSEKVDVITH